MKRIYNYLGGRIQNLFLTAQSTQIKSVISVPIKDFIHHYPRALFNDIPMVGAYLYDIPGSGRTFMTYPGRAQFNDIPGSMGGRTVMNNYILLMMRWEDLQKFIKNGCKKKLKNHVSHMEWQRRCQEPNLNRQGGHTGSTRSSII